jgi:hypothetical protein
LISSYLASQRSITFSSEVSEEGEKTLQTWWCLKYNMTSYPKVIATFPLDLRQHIFSAVSSQALTLKWSFQDIPDAKSFAKFCWYTYSSWWSERVNRWINKGPLRIQTSISFTIL